MSELKGKVCMVTGGASGIGLAICEELASHGVKVAVLDINETLGKDQVNNLKSKFGAAAAIFCKCDVTNISNFRDCFKEVVSKFGHIDILCNNAGIWNDGLESWSLQIDINLKGVVNGCILALDFMGSSKGGSGGTVINSSSLLGLHPFPIVPIYTATKAAVLSLTRCFGDPIHYDKNKVRFMAICPDATSTHLFDGIEKHFLFPEFVDYYKELEKQKEFQPPSSVAKCIKEMLIKGDNGSVWFSSESKPGRVVQFTDVPILPEEIQALGDANPSIIAKLVGS